MLLFFLSQRLELISYLFSRFELVIREEMMALYEENTLKEVKDLHSLLLKYPNENHAAQRNLNVKQIYTNVCY